MAKEKNSNAKKNMSDKEEDELEMDQGEKDEDLETEEGREAQLEDDEIDAAEEGFMQGEGQADNYKHLKKKKK